MLWNLLWPLPFLLVAVAGAVVVARAPVGSRWRVPALAGFALLALAQVVELVRTLVTMTAEFGSSLLAIFTVTGLVHLVLDVTGMVLLVVAFARVARDRAAPAGGQGWGTPLPPPLHLHPAPQEVPPAPSPTTPHGTDDVHRPGAGG